MSRLIANVDVSTDTFYAWVGKTNQIATTFQETVTVKANTAGDMTSGNGFVNGYFGANTMTATFLRGGNVQSSSVLTFTSNAALGNSTTQISVSQNGVTETVSKSVTTTNTDIQSCDTFLKASYRTAKYLISMTNTDNNYYQSTEIMVMHDGTTAYSTEYATLLSNVTLGTFAVDINTDSVRLRVTPTYANNVIKVNRILMAV